MQLKPIGHQVAVVLGASSGIGRETALRLAAGGARVVVAARSASGLASLVDEIAAAGGEAVPVVCDVRDASQVRAVGDAAVAAFGGVDTWVNVAAVSVYARFEETSPEEFRQIIEVNYLGQVHGALAALPLLRERGGGALIAISSVEGIVSMPLHSAYSASKHAVEGAMDALRRELRADGVPISVTSVKPATVNTPFFDNSRNKMDVKPKGPPPIYQPGVVADCVLYAAEHPVRDLYAGGAARSLTMGQLVSPRLIDAALSRFGIPAQRTREPEPGGARGNLERPRDAEQRTHGDFGARARPSLYTWLRTRSPGAVHAASVRIGRVAGRVGAAAPR